jgi:uncharacterized protein YdiU (UPF0061 family)
VYTRAAAHQKTSDNTGIIPIPQIGEVINFIDSSRPMVSAIGPREMPSQNWYRPLITQQPTVGVQGSAGAAADEKSELVSQKMTITKLTGTAVTYGGYRFGRFRGDERRLQWERYRGDGDRCALVGSGDDLRRCEGCPRTDDSGGGR